MDALVDNYRHFVESKIPRGARLAGWFTLGLVNIYTLRCLAASAAQKKVRKIREQEASGISAKK